mmetsp:Transcript_17206/g.60065  ORF Transcript_17206/g.60065 Transcript_17206/m.60065 type:complete len:214 (-) Transcript_17206:371-1012(-)
MTRSFRRVAARTPTMPPVPRVEHTLVFVKRTFDGVAQRTVAASICTVALQSFSPSTTSATKVCRNPDQNLSVPRVPKAEQTVVRSSLHREFGKVFAARMSARATPEPQEPKRRKTAVQEARKSALRSVANVAPVGFVLGLALHHRPQKHQVREGMGCKPKKTWKGLLVPIHVVMLLVGAAPTARYLLGHVCAAVDRLGLHPRLPVRAVAGVCR